MTTISQQTLLLETQSQLRNADKLARDWAIAHAGSYQGQARKELGGNLSFRKWERDNLVICLSKPQSPLIKQCQVVSVRYRPSMGANPYTGYLVTYLPAEGERQLGCLIAAIDQPDTLEAGQLPLDDSAGRAGLDALVAAVATAHTRPRSAASNLAVAVIDDLFDHQDWAIVLTEEGQQDDALRELAAGHSDWAHIVNLNIAGQLAICRELPESRLAGWVRAKIAAFSRYPDRGGLPLAYDGNGPGHSGGFSGRNQRADRPRHCQSEQPYPAGTAGIHHLRNAERFYAGRCQSCG